MRVTLFHNPTAGDDDHAAETLRALIAGAGHEVSYVSTKEAGWLDALEREADLVAVAGGDGAVGKVFREVATKGIPVTLLPVGSANNLAGALGIADVEVETLVRGWADAEARRLDVGEATAPWGDALFVESAGGGIFGEVLVRGEGVDESVDVGGEEKVDLGLELMREVIEGATAREWTVEVDGDELAGELLGVEVMNLAEMGPNFPIAPHADPSDGLLDVVLIREEDRAALLEYLSGRLRDLEPAPPELTRRRGKRIVLTPPAEVQLHLDDRFWPEAETERGGGSGILSCGPSLTVLVPKRYQRSV
jgi:diacylglycerol kinase (ATP)